MLPSRAGAGTCSQQLRGNRPQWHECLGQDVKIKQWTQWTVILGIAHGKFMLLRVFHPEVAMLCAGVAEMGYRTKPFHRIMERQRVPSESFLASQRATRCEVQFPYSVFQSSWKWVYKLFPLQGALLQWWCYTPVCRNSYEPARQVQSIGGPCGLESFEFRVSIK